MGILIENKSRGIDLDKEHERGKNEGGEKRFVTPFAQAKWYADNLPHSIRPRYILTCNFDEIRIYDLEASPFGDNYESITLDDLPDQLHRLNFFTRKENSRLQREKELSIAAGSVVGRIYDLLVGLYKHLDTDENEQRSLNVLIVRIVFLLYAEDAGLLATHQAFYEYLQEYSASQMRDALTSLFDVLRTPDGTGDTDDERDDYLADNLKNFPYINGGLFEEDITIPQFSPELRECLLREASSGFDWKDISPTIFGAIFESALNPETRRSGGMHYTSIENIHKVIVPLFLDDLKNELISIENMTVLKNRTRSLRLFQEKLAGIKILDPACGSGNFLTETYIQLRELENRVLGSLSAGIKGGTQPALNVSGGSVESTFDIKVTLDQFYGIEINDYAVEVAKTALWIAEQQMLEKTQEILFGQEFDFLPLKSNTNIVCANALRIDWNEVIPANECDYIIGNPPFLGSSVRSKEQTADMKVVFGEEKKWGKCDYCVGWYRKAADYMKETNCRAALVSTNSITQGEQVKPTWHRLFDMGIEIDFAWRTFIWNSEATEQAHVHCVIVGFSYGNNSDKKLFDNNGNVKTVNNINGYLVEAPTLFLPSRCQPVDNMHKSIIQGCKPVDGGGLIVSAEEYVELRHRYPQLDNVIRPYLGADEYIKGKKRYCLWLKDANLAAYTTIPEVTERLAIVKRQRQASPTKEFQEYADKPHLFVQDRHPDCDYLIIPQVSGERRRYIPIGFLPDTVIMSNAAYGIPHADIFDFGITSSLMLNAWMRAVAGRLKSDYRFSPVVYNTFAYPNPTQEQRETIKQCAQRVLDVRDEYPDKSLAQLYDPDKMPADLLAAHHALDKAVEAAYGVDFNGDEEKIVAHLFKLYAQATQNE